MNVTMAGYQAITLMHGGPNTQLRNTARHLTRFGVKVSFLDPWSRIVPGEVDLFHLFAANIGTYHVAREMRRMGIRMVVSPIIYSLHSPPFIRRTLAVTRMLQKLGRGIWSDYGLTAEICGWAERVLPNTQAEATLIEKGLGIPRERITVIPNGVDDRFAKGTPSLFARKYGVKDFILNVGHTGHERKNVLRLIQALADVDRPAVIIGRIVRGPYGDACVQEARKHKHIRLIEGIENDSSMLASAYAACNVFVLPSMFETPGIAALEAGLAGAKVVITKYGGTTEYFGEMATYVEPRSVESIRKGILSALELKKSSALRQHIKANYLWSKVAAKTAEVYREVVGGRNL